ncbi:MAG: hypothetical protein AAF849_03205 [Bacteroidota bacterium]
MKNTKRIEELFVQHLMCDLDLYFGRKEAIKEDYERNIIKYLLARKLISKQEATYYVVLKEIQDLLHHKICSKTQAVLRISADLDISERSVWGILKNHQRRFNFDYVLV